ncbi:uncharacterized [Lates japonicus]
MQIKSDTCEDFKKKHEHVTGVVMELLRSFNLHPPKSAAVTQEGRSLSDHVYLQDPETRHQHPSSLWFVSAGP